MKKYYRLLLLLSSLLLFGCNSTDKSTTVSGSDDTGDTNSSSDIGTLSESNRDIPSETIEACSSTVELDTRNTIIQDDQYALTWPTETVDNASQMRYCPEQVESNGSAFEADYVDPNPGEGGADGYVAGIIGGVQNSGDWQAGDYEFTGMPVLLSDLEDEDTMIIQWKVSQDDDNSFDDDDKWMASINVVFDDGEPDAKPDSSKRDYDLVIELNHHNFRHSNDDTIEGARSNYLARNPDGSLRTFNIIVDGETYRYGVRYKFFNYSSDHKNADKNDKVHVKYIPIDAENIPPYINHSLKAFIDNSKDFIQYVNMPDDKRALAHEKVALPTLYIKSIRAGYEIYKGESTLRNDFFRVIFE